MQMAKLNKDRLLFGVFLIIMIAVAEVIFGAFKIDSWIWPGFIVMIWFFAEHMDKKKVPNIIVGGLFGLFNILIGKYVFVALLGSVIGEGLARLIFILVFVYAIIALGEILPILFNIYAFLGLLVTSIAIKVRPLPHDNADITILIWMGVYLVVGLIFIYGILGSIKLIGAMKKK
ncbi:MAG: hypothetical protein A2W19_00025 [Spirochaetes bacterium RBG_16_49_21]|nr:MAG: hypothetical protein A2W19_00025 [Spirochaetes bacterium RBG_16_49_21]